MDDFEKNELNINETPSENEKRPDDVQTAQTDAAQTTPSAETPDRPQPRYAYDPQTGERYEVGTRPEPHAPAGQPPYHRPNPPYGAPAQTSAQPPRYEYSYRNGQPQTNYNYGGEYGYGRVAPNGTYSYSSPQQPPRPPKKPKEKKKFGIGAVCALLVAAIILSTGLGIGGSYMLFGRNGTAGGSQTSSGGNTVIYESTEPKVDTSSVAGSTDTAKVVAAVENSVVEITTETVTTSTFFGQYVTQGAGSGVVVSADGYIVTNNHVVDGATNIKVTLANKTTYDATVVGTDEKTDIAVVKINASGLTPAVFGDSSQIVVGQDVVVIGNPLGSLGGSVTKGIVSALDRQVTIENQTMTLLQIDAAVNPGNSGGGAFDANGNLIGIVNAKSTGSNIDNLGFAIPVNTAKTVINDIIQYGYVTGRISTGFEPIDLTDRATAISYRVSRTGIYVYKVTDATSQFRSGDLLVSMDGTVISSMSDYNSVVDAHKIGDTIDVTIIRNGEQKTVTLTFGEYVPSQNG